MKPLYEHTNTTAGRQGAERASIASHPIEGRTHLMTNLSFIDPPSLRSMDSSPIRGTSLELLDMDEVTTHIDRAVERGRYTGPATAKEYLLRKQCIIEVEDATYENSP